MNIYNKLLHVKMSNIKELKILSKGFGRFLILIYIYTAKRVFLDIYVIQI